MKRYYKNGEGFNSDDDDDDDELDESDGNDDGDDGYIDVDADDIMNAMKMDLVEVHLNQKMLDKAIDIAKKDWLWYFRSPSKKVKVIKKIYTKLVKMMNGE